MPPWHERAEMSLRTGNNLNPWPWALLLAGVLLAACDDRLATSEDTLDMSSADATASDAHDDAAETDGVDTNTETCTPASETCNGVDDDCDGEIDEGTGLCPTVARLHQVCIAGTCQPDRCDPGFGDCNGDAADGCEQSLQDDPRFCGACDNTCDIYGTEMACEDGECVLLSCDDGFADCNGDAADGCEVNLRIHSRHCGACGVACSASARCLDGTCYQSSGAVSVFSRGGSEDASYSCIATPAGELWCWGYAGIDGVLERTPIHVSDIDGVTDIATHVDGREWGSEGPRARVGCALSGGVVTCWEDESPLDGLTGIRDIAMTEALQCAVSDVGVLECFGEVSTPSLPESVVAVDLTWFYARTGRGCALQADGTISCWAWKDGRVTALRDGVAGVSGAQAVAVSGKEGCALLSDGRIRCFEFAFSPDATEVVIPDSLRTVEGAEDAVALDGGGRHFCAILADDEIVCWGEPGSRLGRTDPEGREDAEPIATVQPAPPDGRWIDISCGKTRCCALHSSGAAACWGESESLDVGGGIPSFFDEARPHQLTCLSPDAPDPADGEVLCDFANEDCDDDQDEGCRRCGGVFSLVMDCTLAEPENGCSRGFECFPSLGFTLDHAVSCQPITPDIELCDGVDNDCDPSTPDGFDDPALGEPCDGPDTDACAEGVIECQVDDNFLSGLREVRLGCSDDTDNETELCGNRVDDDCDGDVDEGC